MILVCCDTSFLLSLYGKDGHTARARTMAEKARQPFTLSVLNEFELENAVRLALWRGALAQNEGDAVLADFRKDVELGRLRIMTCDLAQVLHEAKRLSSLYTLTQGCRSFDILLVAAAVHLQAGSFLTFDARQRDLAARAGLKINS